MKNNKMLSAKRLSIQPFISVFIVMFITLVYPEVSKADVKIGRAHV